MSTEREMAPVIIRALINDENLLPEVRNIETMAIIAGNRPLHGTKQFVIMAISRSLGESIILAPVTPTAPQPSPMHIVRACFPHAPAALKLLSRLNATRGRYPKSSSKVKSGKKIAIGGSITETTQLNTRQTPFTIISARTGGAFIAESPLQSHSSAIANPEAIHCDG